MKYDKANAPLAEAIERYPIGTVYIDAEDNSEHTVYEHLHATSYKSWCIITDARGGAVWESKYGWAEIISTPKTRKMFSL